MERTEKIVVLDNQVQAKLMEEILTGMDIPFILRTYHDSAYDGLWQTQSGWGHIESLPEYREKIQEVFDEVLDDSKK